MRTEKTFEATLEEMPHSNIYNRHIKVPKKVHADWVKNNLSKRILWSISSGEKHSSAFMPYGNGIYFINVNRAVCKKEKIDVGDTFQISLFEDKSKYGIPLPEEMEVLLEQDMEGNKYFHALTPGKQRSLLHIIGKPKSSDIRLRKAITSLNYLKLVHGKLDFKELNQAFKESNK